MDTILMVKLHGGSSVRELALVHSWTKPRHKETTQATLRTCLHKTVPGRAFSAAQVLDLSRPVVVLLHLVPGQEKLPQHRFLVLIWHLKVQPKPIGQLSLVAQVLVLSSPVRPPRVRHQQRQLHQEKAHGCPQGLEVPSGNSSWVELELVHSVELLRLPLPSPLRLLRQTEATRPQQIKLGCLSLEEQEQVHSLCQQLPSQLSQLSQLRVIHLGYHLGVKIAPGSSSWAAPVLVPSPRLQMQQLLCLP
jgi:hypothetical protein